MIEKITDMIYVERDVLSQEQCDELIKYFWESEDKHDDGKVEHFKDGVNFCLLQRINSVHGAIIN